MSVWQALFVGAIFIIFVALIFFALLSDRDTKKEERIDYLEAKIAHLERYLQSHNLFPPIPPMPLSRTMITRDNWFYGYQPRCACAKACKPPRYP